MTLLSALLDLLAGPAIALAAGVGAWGWTRRLAPPRAANDNAPRWRGAPREDVIPMVPDQCDGRPLDEVPLRLVGAGEAG